jgi:predicted phage baseplate assembly protein
LEVYVDGRMWARVDTLFGQPPDAEVYIVREDAEGASWVQFGDGQTGKRLPSGVDNVVARYRTGTGAFGPLKEETTVQPGQRLDRLGPVQLPGLITGGDQPEAPDKAREAAPGRLQTLGRLVSLDDYRHEALALSGVATARAAWALVDQVPTMVVTVLMDTGRGGEIDQVEQILRDANRCRGARRFPIVVQPGRRWYVAVAADVAYDPALRESDVLEAVRAALGSTETEDGLFALRQRAFAQPEYATRIAATIQEVDGVGWTTITGLHTLGAADDPADLVVPAVLPLSAALACDDQHVLALDPAHVFLHPIALTPEEAC